MSDIQWKEWPYRAIKPHCLFCDKPVFEAATLDAGMCKTSIRACESEECRKKAVETCETLANAAL